jgi:uncharacterized protein (DUF2267 family)
MNSTQIFATTLQKTNEWLRDIGRFLDTDDPHVAYTALRATLHALRDHLTIDEAAQLSAQLPMLIRGIFYEGWNPSRGRHAPKGSDEFFESFLRQPGNGQALADPEPTVRAVFKVLRRHISPGEMDQAMSQLPARIRELGD